MRGTESDPICQRVVIVTPIGRDAALTESVLGQASIATVVCHGRDDVLKALEEGAGVLLVAEEAIGNGGWRSIAAVLSRQPPWSDLPIFVLTRYGADSPTVAAALHALGNVTLLERPVRPTTLVSAVRAGLKARARQYQVALHLAEQKRTNAELEASIKERERVEERLRDADRRKNEFLATLAHELRNPLAPIRNALHILHLSEDCNPAVQQVCEMMSRQVGHLVRLVDDLMDVSRITRGQVALKMEPVELAFVVRSAVEESRPIIDAARHQLAIAIPSEPLTISGDPLRLVQVFANLLNNSAKYMHEGGQIWLSATRRDNTVLISVRDTGIGIAPDMLPHVFKMFTQVDRSNRRAQGGLGIGLTLVRSLVEMHGGRIDARSDGLGCGSEFVVELPLNCESIEPVRTDADSRVPRLPNRRVLVVDDNQDAGESLGLLLELLGSETRVVHNGLAALELIPEFRPSVVLLDIGMPGMDGYETARRIRKLPEGREVMLIALTGWGQDEDRRRSREAGFDHHLLKPADISALKSIFLTLRSE